MSMSHNEAGSLMAKAARGAGLPHGIADDVARAGCWLAARGYNGAGAVLKALDGIGKGANAGCVAIGGLSVFERMATGAARRAKWPAADSPLLLFGFAGIAAADYALRTRLTFGGIGDALVSAEGVICAISPPLAAADIVIAKAARFSPPAPPRLIAARLSVRAAAKSKLEALAFRVYVPSGEKSRLAGAGAGLTDND